MDEESSSGKVTKAVRIAGYRSVNSEKMIRLWLSSAKWQLAKDSVGGMV